MKFKNFILDNFQEEAIKYIEENFSVVVSAATGTGKTLIADYIVSEALKTRWRVIYTAPIKALSNQKYRDFKEDYGEDKVGIMTGDVVINPDAQVLIMTTEIYRNMLMAKDRLIDDVHYVVFDEIHYINDRERGTIWEESIIFSPSHIRFLCLSATIPNAREFAEWIKSITGNEVKVVRYDKRAVPLEHFVFDSEFGMIGTEKLSNKLTTIGSQRAPVYNVNKFGKRKKIKPYLVNYKPPSHIDLIDTLSEKGFLPCFYFSFSRKDCEKKALELSKKHDYLSPAQKKEVIEFYNQNVLSEVSRMECSHFLKNLLTKGIAIHHAGMLPNLKEIVEKLFSRKLISILYTTETFAVGINMPAKAVCFDALRKFDGISFRPLRSKEYFQMAGRAGRRGIDKVGYSITIYDRKYNDLEAIETITSKDTENLESQFKLTYNTVLNLVINHEPNQYEIILKKSFDYFLKKKNQKNIRIMSSFNHMVDRLCQMGYVSKDNLRVTQKGFFASRVYSNELILTEIFFSDLYKEMSDIEINVLVGTVAYEERRNDYFKLPKNRKVLNNLNGIISKSKFLAKNINLRNLMRLYEMIRVWCEGFSFSALSEYTNLDEGDIIRFFRQIIDYERQIEKATFDDELKFRISKCMLLIKRDLVDVSFE